MKTINSALGLIGAMLLLIALGWMVRQVPYAKYLWYAGAIGFIVVAIIKARRDQKKR